MVAAATTAEQAKMQRLVGCSGKMTEMPDGRWANVGIWEMRETKHPGAKERDKEMWHRSGIQNNSRMRETQFVGWWGLWMPYPAVDRPLRLPR